MDRNRMQALIAEHLDAESRGDVAGAVAVYTPDVEHDVVGSAMGVLTGPEQAARVYEHLIANMKFGALTVNREYFGEDFAVVEHTATGTVVGEFMGQSGHGRQVQFRMLHVWEFAADRISRENVWLDGAAITRQLTTGP